MTVSVTVNGLTIVPNASFKVAIKAIIETNTLDLLFENLESQGIKDIHISQKVMEAVQSFFKDQLENNLISTSSENANKVIQCATCCNGCHIGDNNY